MRFSIMRNRVGRKVNLCFWRRDKLAVLSPESFRDDMIDILRATLSSYETGENNAIDE